MHGIDLSAIATVDDLQTLIEDAQAEIARREAQERETVLRDLEALAAQYGKSVADFLQLSGAAAPAKKAPAKKAAPRQKTTLEDAVAPLREAGRAGESEEPA